MLLAVDHFELPNSYVIMFIAANLYGFNDLILRTPLQILQSLRTKYHILQSGGYWLLVSQCGKYGRNLKHSWRTNRSQKWEKKHLGDQIVINSYVYMFFNCDQSWIKSYLLLLFLETISNYFRDQTKLKIKSWRPTSQVFQSGWLATGK